MTQIDPRNTTTTTESTPGGPPPGKASSSYNWRVSVGMAFGLALLFGVLFGLRALGIFPPRPTEDPEVAAGRATLAALSTQQPAAVTQPTTAPAPALNSTGSEPTVPSRLAPNGSAPSVATPVPTE